MNKKIISAAVVTIVLLGLLLWGLPASFFSSPIKTSAPPTSVPSGENGLSTHMEDKGKILMVVAFRDFRDEEYFVPKEILEKDGFAIDTTSTEKGMATGSQGGEAIVNVDWREVNPAEYRAIVFCGGSGMAQELNNENFQKLAEDFNAQQKVVAAICVAPALLAKAGVLNGKKATVWSAALDKSMIKILQENGAEYQDESVVADGHFITANGPDAAAEFGEKIKTILNAIK